MRRLVLPALLAFAGCGKPGHPDDFLPLAEPATVSGSWERSDEVLSFTGGIAHGNAFFHDGRAIVALTTWEGPSCEGDDWLKGQTGHVLEVPIDGDGSVERATLQRGEPVSGTLTLLDDGGEVASEVVFEVVYCGDE
jgi:hypothetical protein